jgi:hypothetical protein
VLIPAEITSEYLNNPKDEDRRFFRNLPKNMALRLSRLYFTTNRRDKPEITKDSTGAAGPNVHTVFLCFGDRAS